MVRLSLKTQNTQTARPPYVDHVEEFDLVQLAVPIQVEHSERDFDAVFRNRQKRRKKYEFSVRDEAVLTVHYTEMWPS